MKRSKLIKVLVMIGLGMVLVTTLMYVTPIGKEMRIVLAETLSSTRYEPYARVLGVELEKKAPPLPRVVVGNTEVPVKQSSYCWGELGCADYAGGIESFEGRSPTIVTPEASMKFTFDYQPGPAELHLNQIQDSTNQDIPIQDSDWITPKDKGVYYYHISASWEKKGSTSATFVIEVK
ncbi:hypothetical protein BVG16_12225 [Paenibacillus selenitireducens]|uniref:Uncharacterized protein n=1 Tax=Paenibacillus selenitireducens TaxID=1324314 RepID=A0A1T2XFG1_9BACL|nr:hypothetical protein [Paenibacillus selenitireducens]OPA78624.1 hypothetical protein BVG16_12225 [Paenibacillus selenitireducens]